MVVELELETAGILGADVFLVGDERPQRLTAFPYGPAGE
jgi:hypothetical protein